MQKNCLELKNSFKISLIKTISRRQINKHIKEEVKLNGSAIY